MNAESPVLACSMNFGRLAVGTAITKPSMLLMALLLFGWMGCARGGSRAVRDIRFDQLAQQHQRFLPAEVTLVDGDDVGVAFLDPVRLGSTWHLREADGDVHFAGPAGVVTAVVRWDGRLCWDKGVRP